MIIEFEGQQHSFPDDFTDADISKALGPKSSTAADVVQSAGSGLVRGVTGLAGLPGSLSDLVALGMRKGASALGVSPETAQKAEALRNNIPGDIAAPRPETIQQGVEGVTGPMHEPQTTAGKYARTIGEFAPGAAFGGGGAAARIGLGVVAPAVGSEAAGQAFGGSKYEPYARVGGALAGALAPSVAARAITPFPATPARQQATEILRNEGVPMSAGQATGSKPLQYMESMLGDTFGTGGQAAAMADRTGEGFTGAALRRTGENAPRATPEVVDRAFGRLGQQFDDLAARNQFQPDQQFGQEFQAAVRDYRGLVSPPNRAPAIENFEAEIATQLARGGGSIPGDAYQSLRSRLERAARGAGGTPEVAHTLRDMRAALDDAVERNMARTNSPDLGAWQQTRTEYRNLLAVEDAVTRGGEKAAEGLISPSGLRSAVVNQGKRAYARGQGDFADLARAGEAVLKPLPQSGTGPRFMAQSLLQGLGAAAGGAVGNVPGAVAGAVGAAAAPAALGRILMSRPAQAYLGNQAVAGGGGMDRALAQLLLSEARPPATR